MSLVYLAGAWVAGLWLGERIYPPLPLLFLALAFIFITAFLCRRQPSVLKSGLWLSALIMGLIRVSFPSSLLDMRSLAFYNDQGLVSMEGVVVYSDAGETRRELHLAMRRVKEGLEWKPISGTALAYTSLFPVYGNGDVLRLVGEPKTPPAFPDFDYRDYLARRGIPSIISYPDISWVGQDGGFTLGAEVYELRGEMGHALAAALPEPQASLAQGMLLGLRRVIPDELMEAFNRAGTTHVIAISGQNITIVAALLAAVSAWLFGRGRLSYLATAVSAVWIYSLLAGMSPSVVRAAIMASLFLWAGYLGRQNSLITALALAAAIMLGLKPSLLRDVSFQLSFLAMVGLIYLTPLFSGLGERFLKGRLGGDRWRRTIAMLVEGCAVTLGATLATYPLIALDFHRVSLVGLPATLLTLLALPGIIVTTALVAVLGLMVPSLAQVAGWFAWPFLTYLTAVVRFFAAWPWASVNIAPPPTLVVVYYLAMAGFILGKGSFIGRIKRAQIRASIKEAFSLGSRIPTKAVIPLALVALLLWTAALTTTSDHRLRVYFLDVGQGDSILIETPSHRHILVDGGPDPQALTQELGKRLPFWDRRLDLLILTHPHEDHLLGLVEVLERYRVGQVLEAGGEYQSPSYEEWQRLVEAKGVKRALAQAGQSIDLGGGARLDVVHPPQFRLLGTDQDIDNNSVVVRLVYGRASFLLTADLQKEGEAYLELQKVDLSSAVLKVGHHGSETSTSAEFLASVNPQVAVVSVGAENRFGHPNPEVMARLKEGLGGDRVYLTSERGTIELSSDGQRLWIKTEK
ncbi:MAG: DNA internalization-related competence protein ComEC/Rec2 [Chloroflexi bacterium]|nr:DNA internalization-related competence protein ComEC/Rec2 [Chloroflexota bacterium]